jgi:hypothetical protein
MAKPVLIDEFHLTLYVAARLPENEIAVVRRTIDSRRFQVALLPAVRLVLRTFPAMSGVSVKLSR